MKAAARRLAEFKQWVEAELVELEVPGACLGTIPVDVRHIAWIISLKSDAVVAYFAFENADPFFDQWRARGDRTDEDRSRANWLVTAHWLICAEPRAPSTMKFDLGRLLGIAEASLEFNARRGAVNDIKRYEGLLTPDRRAVDRIAWAKYRALISTNTRPQVALDQVWEDQEYAKARDSLGDEAPVKEAFEKQLRRKRKREAGAKARRPRGGQS